MSNPTGDNRSAQADEREIEELAQELASRLRSMRNREELTDYAVALLRESSEELNQQEHTRRALAKAAKADAFNPIALGIPLLLVGAVLSATGILVGPGIGVIAIAILMVLYGLVVSLLMGRRKRT